MPEIRRNVEKDGIEIVFPERPAESILSWLKANHYRWSRYSKAWYKKYDDYNWNLASEYFGQDLAPATAGDSEKETSDFIKDHIIVGTIPKYDEISAAHQAIIEGYADHLTKNEVDYYTETFTPHIGEESTYNSIKGTVTQEKIDELISLARKGAMVAAKNYYFLIVKKEDYKRLHGFLTNTANKASRKMFEQVTGIVIGKTIPDAEKALKTYFGEDIVKAEKTKQEAAREARKAELERQRWDKDLLRSVKIGTEVMTWKEHIDKVIADGYNKAIIRKKGVVPIIELNNDKGVFWTFKKKGHMEYIKSVLKEKNMEISEPHGKVDIVDSPAPEAKKTDFFKETSIYEPPKGKARGKSINDLALEEKIKSYSPTKSDTEYIDQVLKRTGTNNYYEACLELYNHQAGNHGDYPLQTGDLTGDEFILKMMKYYIEYAWDGTVVKEVQKFSFKHPGFDTPAPKLFLDPKPIKSKIVSPKTIKEAVLCLKGLVSKDERRPAMQYVYRDESGLVASNSYVLVHIPTELGKEDTLYDAKTGAIFSDAKVYLQGTYPKYKSVIPLDFEHSSGELSLEKLLGIFAAYANTRKIIIPDSDFAFATFVRIVIGDKKRWYDSYKLFQVADALYCQGTKVVTVNYPEGRLHLMVIKDVSDSERVGLVMPIEMSDDSQTKNSFYIDLSVELTSIPIGESDKTETELVTDEVNEMFEGATTAEVDQVGDEYFTRDNAPDNILDRFGVAKEGYLDKRAGIPKTFIKDLPGGEKLYSVDGKYARDYLYSDFSQGGNDMAYPEFVPIGELWYESAMENEKEHIINHEKRERDLMVNAGYSEQNQTKALRYDEAHEIVKNIEDSERGTKAVAMDSKTYTLPELREIYSFKNGYNLSDLDLDNIASGTHTRYASVGKLRGTYPNYEREPVHKGFIIDSDYKWFVEVAAGQYKETSNPYKQSVSGAPEKQTVPDETVDNSKYVSLKQNVFGTASGSIGRIVNKPNPFVTLLYFGRNLSGQKLESKIDNTYLVPVQGKVKVMTEGLSEKFVVEVNKLPEEKAQLDLAKLTALRKFISSSQIEALMGLVRSEEREAGIDIVNMLSEIISTMPKSYETEKTVVDDKIVYLHYFRGDSDFYIAERDKEVVQNNAFGYSILNGDYQMAEWGDISIVELIRNNVELDFYWHPKVFSDVKKKWEPEDKAERATGPGAELMRIWDEKESEIMEGLPDGLKLTKDGGGAYRLFATTREGLDVGIIELNPIDIHSYSPAFKEYLDQVVLRLDFFKNKEEITSIKPSRAQFLDRLSELDLWQEFEGRHYRKFILNPGNERAVTDFGIKESMRDIKKGGKDYIEAIISIKSINDSLEDEIEAAYQENTGIQTTLSPEGSIRLPIVKNYDKEYFVDFKLQQLRDVHTAEPVPFTDIHDEELKAKLRGIRAESGPNVNMPALDDEPKVRYDSYEDFMLAYSKKYHPKYNMYAMADLFFGGRDKVKADILRNRYTVEELKQFFNEARNSGVAQFQGDLYPTNLAWVEEQVKKGFVKPEIVPETPVSVPETSVSVTKADYANEFELNKAIEALLDKKWNDSVDKWSEVELEFIKGYTGYGGLDKFGEITKGSLFEYFTPEQVIERMWGLAHRYGYKDGPLLEPSCGIGPFFDRRYVSDLVEKHGYEINKYSAKIAKLSYPESIINDGQDVKYFEQLFIKQNYTVRAKVTPAYQLVIGNPPYGTVGGIYMGMGEKSYTHANNYIDYFILRGLDLLVQGGLLVYIIGAETAGGGVPFLDQGMNKVKEMIMERGKLIDAYRLPSGVFSRTDVTSDIVVFRKR